MAALYDDGPDSLSAGEMGLENGQELGIGHPVRPFRRQHAF
jgi:hypothetical protein